MAAEDLRAKIRAVVDRAVSSKRAEIEARKKHAGAVSAADQITIDNVTRANQDMVRRSREMAADPRNTGAGRQTQSFYENISDPNEPLQSTPQERAADADAVARAANPAGVRRAQPPVRTPEVQYEFDASGNPIGVPAQQNPLEAMIDEDAQLRRRLREDQAVLESRAASGTEGEDLNQLFEQLGALIEEGEKRGISPPAEPERLQGSSALMSDERAKRPPTTVPAGVRSSALGGEPGVSDLGMLHGSAGPEMNRVALRTDPGGGRIDANNPEAFLESTIEPPARTGLAAGPRQNLGAKYQSEVAEARSDPRKGLAAGSADERLARIKRGLEFMSAIRATRPEMIDLTSGMRRYG